MKVVKWGLLALVLLMATGFVTAQEPPGIPPVTNIVLSADPTVIQKNGVSTLTAQIESDYLDDRSIKFEIVSGSDLADLAMFPPPAETQGDELTVSTDENGIAQAYLVAGSETGTVKIRACWYGSQTVCSNTVDVDIVESNYGVKLTAEETIKNVYQGEVAQFVIRIKNTGLNTDSFNINVNAPSEVQCEPTSYYVENIPSGEIEILTLNVSSETVGNHTIAVTATSVNDPSATDTIYLYLNVTKRILEKFPGCEEYPSDPDNDGLYEDTNGNGEKDLNDLLVLFNNMDWVEENGYTQYFDFNGNNDMDMNDLLVLFNEI